MDHGSDVEIISDRGGSTNSMVKSTVEEKEPPLTRSMSILPSGPSVFKRCIEHIMLDLLPRSRSSGAIASFWLCSSKNEGVFRIREIFKSLTSIKLASLKLLLSSEVGKYQVSFS